MCKEFVERGSTYCDEHIRQGTTYKLLAQLPRIKVIHCKSRTQSLFLVLGMSWFKDDPG